MLTSILCRLSNGPPLSLRNGLQVLMKTRVFLFRPSDFVLQYSLITNLCFCIYVCTHSSELFCFVRTLPQLSILFVWRFSTLLSCTGRYGPLPHCFNKRVLANIVFHQCVPVKQLVFYVLENSANVPGS